MRLRDAVYPLLALLLPNRGTQIVTRIKATDGFFAGLYFTLIEPTIYGRVRSRILNWAFGMQHWTFTEGEPVVLIDKSLLERLAEASTEGGI